MFGCPMTEYDKKVYEEEINLFVSKSKMAYPPHLDWSIASIFIIKK